MGAQPADITQILSQVASGDRSAGQQLLVLLYDELHNLAAARMARLPRGQTLQTTALLHEAYLRLLGNESARWENRRHFFFAAARAMRDIVVENARRKRALKRGGDRNQLPLDSSAISIPEPSVDVLALNDALQQLERDQPDNARIVMLRYFAGLTQEETAELLQTSVSTVERKWRFIRAWLRRALGEPEARNRTDA